MKKGTLPEAPNYTNAALVMGLVNLLWVLMVLWAVFGLPVVLAISYGLNRLITWMGQRA
ncbi:hypothetical protein [Roseovarius indicus]|jgi:hypothetical protein|uniref:Histidinol phosphate aminotransferase n=1 Tax=Roseovarius indicus TaxID=540747 RepID=A0A5P3AEH4_9RHOB|nr:hypothetical protein [Roseovarius indicus]QEW27742.1 hypothetical protein RIdsm_03561 [Roseovarius indicus]SFE31885.1 hypothetical protein SAMN04488031_10835 [Roseovarius indicus]